MIMKKKLIFILSIGFAFGVADAASSREKVTDILNKIPKSINIGGAKKIVAGGGFSFPGSRPSVTTKNGRIAIEIGKSGVKLSDLFKTTAKTSVGKSSLVDKYRASGNSSKVDRSIRNYAHSARENERVFGSGTESNSTSVTIGDIFEIIIEETGGYIAPNKDTE